MDENVYESPSLVLREIPGDEVLDELAGGLGWLLIADNSEEQYARHSRERSWQVSDSLFVHMIGDNLSGYCAFTVTSTDSHQMSKFTELLVLELNPFTRAELLAPVPESADAVERMHAVMRLALGAPEEFDPEMYDRVVLAAADPEPGVRDAAVWVSAYVAWPMMRQLLRRVAEQDPVDEVRMDAENLLRMYDDAGVPQA